MTSIKTIFEKKDYAELIRFAEAKGNELSNADLSTSQVRNVLDTIQMMKHFDPAELQLLRPKLAYAAGKKSSIKPFRAVIEEAIGCVKNDEDFRLFRNLIEAIVAYHTLAQSYERHKRSNK